MTGMWYMEIKLFTKFLVVTTIIKKRNLY